MDVHELAGPKKFSSIVLLLPVMILVVWFWQTTAAAQKSWIALVRQYCGTVGRLPVFPCYRALAYGRQFNDVREWSRISLQGQLEHTRHQPRQYTRHEDTS